MNRNRGFTLVELMVTLVVAAILLALAIPSFSAMLRKNRAATDISALTTTIAYARSEAVARNTEICVAFPTGGGWKDGWEVRIENGSCGGETLRVFAPISSTATLSVTRSSGAVSKFGFTSAGFRSGSPEFVITYFAAATCDPDTGRVLTINATGRVTIAACVAGT